MTDAATDQKLCPFCRQKVKLGATKCIHCFSAMVPPIVLEHDGVCPTCAEEIPQDAIVCYHCRTAVHSHQRDDDAKPYSGKFVYRIPRKNLPLAASEYGRAPVCPPYIQHPEDGTVFQCLIDQDSQYCIYESCGSGPAPRP